MGIQQVSKNDEFSSIAKEGAATLACAVLAPLTTYAGKTASNIMIASYAIAHGTYHAIDVFSELESKSSSDDDSILSTLSTAWSFFQAVTEGVIIAQIDLTAANVTMTMASPEGISYATEMVTNAQNYAIDLFKSDSVDTKNEGPIRTEEPSDATNDPDISSESELEIESIPQRDANEPIVLTEPRLDTNLTTDEVIKPVETSSIPQSDANESIILEPTVDTGLTTDGAIKPAETSDTPQSDANESIILEPTVAADLATDEVIKPVETSSIPQSDVSESSVPTNLINDDTTNADEVIKLVEINNTPETDANESIILEPTVDTDLTTDGAIKPAETSDTPQSDASEFSVPTNLVVDDTITTDEVIEIIETSDASEDNMCELETNEFTEITESNTYIDAAYTKAMLLAASVGSALYLASNYWYQYKHPLMNTDASTKGLVAITSETAKGISNSGSFNQLTNSVQDTLNNIEEIVTKAIAEENNLVKLGEDGLVIIGDMHDGT